ncbi:uncharacterized protein LAESUDRAFT_724191 [Laetiporus sulphureus 93-53]|uniref:Uncharacterized protein n=1 Tax=Laetiporus sulphureus 93-53 TaxID=1314785 RepID=A0A165F1L1_9APHY|nr:uncharacterized protein LAESUDRAFT_724191 [Laetiporus sulphureus 93-53]KZT08180.1 hypothetical protein LAESUDRAFT_724191 [Laetiporus sulphureus 93-53]
MTINPIYCPANRCCALYSEHCPYRAAVGFDCQRLNIDEYGSRCHCTADRLHILHLCSRLSPTLSTCDTLVTSWTSAVRTMPINSWVQYRELQLFCESRCRVRIVSDADQQRTHAHTVAKYRLFPYGMASAFDEVQKYLEEALPRQFTHGLHYF